MPTDTTQLTEILAASRNLDPAYRHYPKRVTPGEPFETPTAVLKWYGLHADDRPIPEEITRLARERLAAAPDLPGGLGFVVLHRCGTDFYFLIVCTWRNSNEMWQTVFYKDGDSMAEFELFPRDETHKPTLCVWELVPVCHESLAWSRFLQSVRDEAAAQAWRNDRFSGPA